MLPEAPEKVTPEDIQFIRDTYMDGKQHLFVRDVLGANTWDFQDELILSVFKYKTTAAKTCNAVGKSYTAAKVAVSFLSLLPHSIVVTTAPTWRQVTDVLWREIATTVKRSQYKLTENEVTQAGLSLDTDWYAVGLSTKYPENFFGYHADHILVIVDEAGGVPEPIFKGVKAITPNANARVLYIGNPTNPDGTFFEAFSNPRIKRFTVSAFDTPNFIHVGIRDLDDLIRVMTPPAGVDPLEHNPFADVTWPYPALIAPEVVFERFHEWGVDSPAWQSLVMGEFPSQSEQSLIPVDLVIKAMNAGAELKAVYSDPNNPADPNNGKTFAELKGSKIPTGKPIYGLDMARFGSDSTVLTPRRGGWVSKQIKWNKVDLIESADRVLKLVNPTEERSRIKIDDTGNGGGTTDALRRYKVTRGDKIPYQYDIDPYNFGHSASDKDKFHDITSELYWNLRQQFYDETIAFEENDKKLFNQLVGRRWSLTPAGKIKVENKDEYKKRTGGKSPDESDSLALAFAPNIAGTFESVGSEHSRIEDDVSETYTGGMLTRSF